MRDIKLYRKTRKPSNPYVTLGDAGGWKWDVLKLYSDPLKPFARAFCNVHGFATEMGDAYTADIPGFAEWWHETEEA